MAVGVYWGLLQYVLYNKQDSPERMVDRSLLHSTFVSGRSPSVAHRVVASVR